MKKRYYIPGIFSIVLLPVLGIWYMNKRNYFQELSAHPFYYMDFEEAARFNKEEGADIFFTDKLVKRIYKEVTLNNDKNAKNTFEYIDEFVNDVVQTKDTVNGLQIHFGENATYNEFIEVLNIFNERNAEIYTLNNNTMYFVGKDWYPNQDAFPFCGTIWGNDIVDDREKTFDFIRTFKNIKTQVLQNKIIYSAYGIFFLTGMFYTYRKNKKLPK